MKPGFVLSAVPAVFALTVVGAQVPPPAVQAGFPARGAWPKAEPAAVGFNKTHLDDAVAFDQFLGKVLAALEP